MRRAAAADEERRNAAYHAGPLPNAVSGLATGWEDPKIPLSTQKRIHKRATKSQRGLSKTLISHAN